MRLPHFPLTATVPNSVLKLSYIDAVEYSSMWFSTLEVVQKEKKQQHQETTTTEALLKSIWWMYQLTKTYNEWNRKMPMRRRNDVNNHFKIYIVFKLGHWAILLMFIVVVLLYDDSIQISRKVIQTLVRTTTILIHSIWIGCTMDVQWWQNLVPLYW